MMPNRMLRDWTMSEKVNILPVQAERFFTRLIMKVDDHGCFHGDTRILKANLFPLLLDTIREADITRWMAECQKAGLIVLYEAEGKKYLQILDFRQRLDRARSKFPLPNSNDSLAFVNEFPPEVERNTEVEVERKGTERADKPPRVKAIVFIPPSVEIVRQFFLKSIGDSKNPGCWPHDRCYNEASDFFDHYTANGWIQGKGKPIKDWQAAARKWIRNGIKGTFQRQESSFENKPILKAPGVEMNIPKLSPIEREINYNYERWLENENAITIISVESTHYDHLKKAGMIQLSSDQVAGIRKSASEILRQKNMPEDEKNITHFMKKIAVLEYFKTVKSSARETIFHLEGEAVTA